MRAKILGVALALAGGAASAQDTAPLALPLAAPESAPPAIADFVAVCSAAVKNLSDGIGEAQRRGWRMDGDQSAMMSALIGAAALSKQVDGADNALLSLNRVVFPHVVASNCMMNLIGADMAAVDTAAIGRIAGIEGGAAAIGDGKFGRWSAVDAAGELLTITDTTGGERFRILNMSRAVLTEAGRAATAARTDR